MNATAARTHVRESGLADRPAVEALLARCGMGGGRSEAFWDHVWGGNPAARRFGLPTRTGWVMEAGGSVVGSFGSIPFVVRYQGADHLAVTGNALAVDPDHRSRSMSLMAPFFRQTEPSLFVSTTTGDASRAVFRNLFKMRVMPAADHGVALIWVLDARRFLAAAMGRFGPAVAVPGSLAGAPILGLESARRWLRVPRPVLEIRPIAAADAGPEFDDLWRRKTSTDPRLMADRSSDAVRWRYGIPDARQPAWLLGAFRNGSLDGFIALRRSTGQGGLRKLDVVDLFADNDDPSALLSLLNAARHAGLEAGDHVLEVLGLPDSIRRVLKLARPFSRVVSPPGSETYLYRSSLGLGDPADWYASANDGDESF